MAGGIERVYFVGAGLSAPFGYPLGGSLPLRIVLDLKTEYRRTRFHSEAKGVLAALSEMLRHYLGVNIDLVRANPAQIKDALKDVKLAEFYSVAHTLSQGAIFLAANARNNARKSIRGALGGQAEDSDPLRFLYSHLSAATRSLFLRLSNPYGRTTPDFRALTAHIVKHRRKHAVVCFNWDEELDLELGQVLKEADVAYTLGEWETYRKANKRVLLLKPHGSIGWYDIAQGIGNSRTYFVADRDKRIPASSLRVVSYWELASPKRLGLNRRDEFSPLECPPVITPPTFVKRFDYAEQRQVWQDVIQVCSNAKEFVFLGYSLPGDDFLTRAAISTATGAGGRRRKTKVRCLYVGHPGKETEANFKRCFPDFASGRDVLPWDFGKGPMDRRGNLIEKPRRELPALLEERLARATMRMA